MVEDRNEWFTWFSFLLPREKSSSIIASKSFDMMSNVSFCCSDVVYLRPRKHSSRRIATAREYSRSSMSLAKGC